MNTADNDDDAILDPAVRDRVRAIRADVDARAAPYRIELKREFSVKAQQLFPLLMWHGRPELEMLRDFAREMVVDEKNADAYAERYLNAWLRDKKGANRVRKPSTVKVVREPGIVLNAWPSRAFVVTHYSCELRQFPFICGVLKEKASGARWGFFRVRDYVTGAENMYRLPKGLEGSLRVAFYWDVSTQSERKSIARHVATVPGVAGLTQYRSSAYGKQLTQWRTELGIVVPNEPPHSGFTPINEAIAAKRKREEEKSNNPTIPPALRIDTSSSSVSTPEFSSPDSLWSMERQQSASLWDAPDLPPLVFPPVAATGFLDQDMPDTDTPSCTTTNDFISSEVFFDEVPLPVTDALSY
jgi:hypothetical protein